MFRVSYQDIGWLDLDFLLRIQLNSNSFMLAANKEEMSPL